MAKKIGQKLIIRLEKGDEIIESLTKLCAEHGVQSATVSGIGATDDVEIGFYDPKTEVYISRKFTADNIEIVSLTGNITLRGGEPFPHIHILIANDDYQTYAGHLLSARISVTCEIILDIWDEPISRS